MVHDVCGCTMLQYARAFDRRNMSDPGALEFAGSKCAILLGREVQAAVSKKYKLSEADWDLYPGDKIPAAFISATDTVAFAVPHSSGRSRKYNDPDFRTQVGTLLAVHGGLR
jgi:hypothetical protein